MQHPTWLKSLEPPEGPEVNRVDQLVNLVGFHSHRVHVLLPDNVLFILQNPFWTIPPPERLSLNSSFPEKVKNSFTCLTSVLHTYVCVSMSHMLLKFFLFTVSLSRLWTPGRQGPSLCFHLCVLGPITVPNHGRHFIKPHKL